jgi:integrase
LVALLRARKEAQGGPDSGAVFKLSLHQLRRAYEAVSSAAGQFSPHDLRRGFATVAQRAMRDEALTKWLLNHAPQGVTQAHYLTRDEARLREAMERVEAAFYSAWT